MNKKLKNILIIAVFLPAILLLVEEYYIMISGDYSFKTRKERKAEKKELADRVAYSKYMDSFDIQSHEEIETFYADLSKKCDSIHQTYTNKIQQLDKQSSQQFNIAEQLQSEIDTCTDSNRIVQLKATKQKFIKSGIHYSNKASRLSSEIDRITDSIIRETNYTLREPLTFSQFQNTR